MTEKVPTARTPENIYNAPHFERSNAKEIVTEFCGKFQSHYANNGYLTKEAVPVSSKVDPSVRLIGSHISVFKPELISRTVPKQGEFIVQDCIRTKNLRGLFDDTYVPGWGSSFTSLGALVPENGLDKATEDQVRFFTETLGISIENIRMRVSSEDTDLLESCQRHLPEKTLEVDTKDPNYYRHVIGIDGVRGRNYNMALRNPNGEGFSDVGNIILLEDNEGALGVETAIGSSVVLKQLLNLNHVNDCYPITGLEDVDPQFKRKIEDSLIVCTTLSREGLRPRGSDNRERIMRSYMRALLYYSARTGIGLDDLKSISSTYEQTQFGTSDTQATNLIFEHLASYAYDLRSGKINGKEDEIISSVLI
jgi:hypothetical protein